MHCSCVAARANSSVHPYEDKAESAVLNKTPPPSNRFLFVWFVFAEQWQELSAGEPGGQGPAAPWDWDRNQATSHPAAGPCRSW